MDRKHPVMVEEIRSALRRVADPQRVPLYQRFFKTGKGEYGEGDRFLGIVVPAQRKVAKHFQDAALSVVAALLKSAYHEERLTALLMLIEQYRHASFAGRSRIVSFYLRHIDRVNNWDLVDISAPRILGEYLQSRSRTRLYALARSPNLWRRRIALLSTFAFIAQNDFQDTLAICRILLRDREDLIHKAVGWALREVGKRDRRVLIAFLDDHGTEMPRTALRYAIEHFSNADRKRWLFATRGKTA